MADLTWYEVYTDEFGVLRTFDSLREAVEFVDQTADSQAIYMGIQKCTSETVVHPEQDGGW